MDSFGFEIRGYRLLELLGRGGSGLVFRAIQETLEREVALKIFALGGIYDDPTHRERFLQEARLQARLRHPNLLPLYDAGVSRSQLFLAVEYMPGGSLSAHLEKNPDMPLAQALLVGSRLASGLAFAHRAGIVHRDLKPQNVLMGPELNVKLADFGLAKAFTEMQAVQTKTGIVMGTLGYIAPEAFSGQPAGPAADVYGLGVLLFQLITGQHPFSLRSVAETFLEQVSGVEETLRNFRTDLPAELHGLLLACMKLQPAERPQASEVFVRLGRLQRSLEPPASRTVAGLPAASTRPGKPRQRSMLLTVAGLAVGVAVLMCWASHSPAPVAAPARMQIDAEAVGSSVRLPLPEDYEVGQGTTSVSFTLKQAAPEGLELVFWSEERRASSRCRVQKGVTRFSVSGLGTATNFGARFVRGSQQGRAFRFGTLRAAQPHGGAMLDASFRSDRVMLAVSGPRAVVSWRRIRAGGHPVLMTRRTDDLGTTWSSPELLSTTGERVIFGSVAMQPSGMLAAWLGESAGRMATRLRRWQSTTRGWGPPLEVAETPEGLLREPPGESRGPRQDWLTASRRVYWVHRRSLPPGFPDTSSPPPVSGWNLLFRVAGDDAGRELLLLDVSESTLSNRLKWVSFETSLPLPWSALQDFETTGAFVSSVDAIAGGGKVAVAFETPEGVHVSVSPDGGRSFPARASTPAEGRKGTMPALAVDAGRFYLGFAAESSSLMAGTICVMSSVDGQRWSLRLSAPLSLMAPHELRLAVHDGRSLAVVSDDVRGLLAYSFPLR